ncbi:MAG TPA: MerR family transcriptional regulator, partial [Solirubrobacteraceae bacterium]|nr:MerR family transcriptional regulator [Solirubrobacteraceae bacterium]
MTQPLSTAEAARRVGVSPGTLRRWAEAGVVPQASDGWDEAALGQARLVARLRSRGHTLGEIAQATGE